MSSSTEAPEQLEPDTFDAFVVERARVLWRSAFLLTGDRHRAEDLVQTALAKTYRHWDRIHAQGSSFEAYVRKTMLNTYVSWWRRKWNAELPSEDVDRAPVSVEPHRDADLHHDLVRALRSLPRGQRAVVVLRYFEDRTEAETADLLGISVGTVKSQTARAMSTLRASTALAGHATRGGEVT